ncbi:PAS domain S-box protein [Geothrix sp. PMB-07]|uniref:PAS domain S-box protein n=1 Tax=Geothrix sp. PMB-07 TaxID=3068640 RepID=UPI002740930A|nr:PAS domain S-box protein [Geothrix sp. PMB-07]WLT31531.1 PAS domain S-box protein [Geothrix sp. PMB-07]
MGLLEKASLAFYIMDREGHLLHANGRFLDCLGTTVDGLADFDMEHLRHDLPSEEAREWFRRAFDRPGDVSEVGLWLRADGTTLPVRMAVVGFHTEVGDRLLGWGRDHSEEKLVLDRLKESAEHQRHLAEGIYALSLTRSREEVFQVLMGRAGAILPGLHWFIGHIGPGEAQRLGAMSGVAPAIRERVSAAVQQLGSPLAGTGFSKEIHDHRRLCFVADAAASAELVPLELAESHRLKSLLGVPLLFEGHITGVLFGLGFQDEAFPIPRESQFAILQNLARIAALALDRIQAEARLEVSASLARNLAAAVKDLAGATREDDLVSTLFRWAAQLAPLQEWWFNRFDAGEGVSSTQYWTAGLRVFGSEEEIRRPVAVNRSPLLEAMYLQHRSIHIPRCESHPDLPDSDLWPFRTFVGLPMVHEGEVLGCLGGASFGPQGHVSISDDQFGALESLAEAAGLVMNRVHARSALEAQETRFRLLFEQSPDPILLLAGGAIVDANAAASELFGLDRSEMAGCLMCALCPECQADGMPSTEGCQAHMEAALSGVHQRFEWTFLCANGRVALCQVNLTRLDHGNQPILHAIVRDMTAQRQAEAERAALERQLFQAQKMESLGVLAGGIAHDFNNLLMGVLGHAGLALEQLSPLHPAKRNLEAIQKAGQRAADLTRQMLAYSGRGQFVVRPLDLTAQVAEMLHLLEVSIPKSVLLNLDLHKGLPAISADATQIQQVIMNLVINAAEAIGEASGAITLSTGAQRLDTADLERMMMGGQVAPGLFVYLQVQDTGCGMDADTVSRIFEPFFTTKFTGRGLGLSAIMGIVRGHQGALEVDSVVGQGTAFKVFFPAQALAAETAALPGLDVPVQLGQGMILVVDDDETVRAVARQALEWKGFQVVEAADGRVAVDLVQEHGGAIGLVLLDMTMPHLGGEGAYMEMRSLQPELKVILSSGYNEAEALSRFQGKGLRGFLQKPYGPRDLISKVLKALED